MICLDANAVIAALGTRAPGLRRRLSEALAQGIEVGVSSIVLYELWFGIRKSIRPAENAAALATFLGVGISPLPFEAEDAEEAGEIRAALEQAGAPIGPYDLLIAAQARRRAATLVTANEQEFSRVPALRVENWST